MTPCGRGQWKSLRDTSPSGFSDRPQTIGELIHSYAKGKTVPITLRRESDKRLKAQFRYCVGAANKHRRLAPAGLGQLSERRHQCPIAGMAVSWWDPTWKAAVEPTRVSIYRHPHSSLPLPVSRWWTEK